MLAEVSIHADVLASRAHASTSARGGGWFVASYRNGLETVFAVSYWRLLLAYGLSGQSTTAYAKIPTHP
jgi:hypothetical protein